MGARCDLPRRRSPSRGEPSRRRSIAATSVALCVLAASPGARADGSQAEALFNDGNRLLKEGKVTQACAAFEASNRLEPGAGTLIALGQCREKARQLASAWLAYKQAAARAKDARKHDFAAARVAELQPQLSYLTLVVPDDHRVDGMTIELAGAAIDRTLWGQPQPVDGGDPVIVVQAPGREPWRTAAHVAATRDKVRIEVPALPEQAQAAAPALAGPTQPPPAEPAAAPVSSPGMFTPMRGVAVGLAGASVIGLVAGVALGASASSKQDDAFRLCPQPATPCGQAARSNALIRASHDRAHDANIAFAIAAGAAFTAGVLWFMGAPTSEHATRVGLAPTLAPGEPGVAVWGRF
ncbi:MAG TPA: hypothetical protein VHW23_05660 [Kofleriaceae bacterium]|jgi:hypothetical protein|nr:hypothetical protein [Kofleriaceae bacterium]